MASRIVYMETFYNKDDADYWLDMHLMEHKNEVLLEASVRYVNGAWIAGCMFGDGQLELELDFE